MAKRVARIVLWLVGSVFALTVLSYAILFVSNLDDRPAIGEIDVLKSLQEPTLPVVNDHNSYLYMLGFSGPPDSNPMTLGLARYRWMETARPELRTADDPLSEDFDFRESRSDAIATLAEICSKSELECLRHLESGNTEVKQWLVDERWLLDRYRSLVDMQAFREAIPFELLAPLPSYGVMFEGQRLHIIDAWQTATDADAEGVRAALDRDLIYWRMVLENSDALITKMIATAAIIRHFKLGNLVLRRLPQDVAADGIPASWRTAISDEERSMKRSLAGEWTYFDQPTMKIATDSANPFGDWMGLTDSNTWDRIAWILLKPFWQPQDLSNRHARLMLDLGNAFDVPYSEIPCTIGLANDLQESAHQPFSRLYNFTGDLVMAANYWGFSDYAVRVSDLEGIRRAALLVAELRADGVPKDEVGPHVRASEIANPYTNEPFLWVDSEDVVVFRGLEPHEERSTHKFVY